MGWQGPLEGIRLTDFCWWGVGALATRTLAAFGAQDIKIENRNHLDMTRRLPPFPDRVVSMGQVGAYPDPNVSGLFNTHNANKLGIVVDMQDRRGREIVHRLIAVSDIVSENFRPGVMERWGLTYEALCKIKPDIIFARLCGFGHSGPEAGYGSAAPSAQALTGISLMAGLPNREPSGWGWGYMDNVASYYGTMGMLMALYHRDLTGEGQELEGAAVEGGVNLLGPDLLDYTANGRGYRREGMPPGNRLTGRPAAPHGVYPTQGEDRWIAIAVFTDDEWERLVGVMGRPGWALQAPFRCIDERMCHQDELDRRIGEWTKGQERYDLMQRLQAAGVRAGVVQNAPDLNEIDPQIRLRGVFPEVVHPVTGRYPVEGIPFKLTGSPVRDEWHSGPCLGQHTEYVLTEILGMSSREVKELAEAGVI